MDPKTRMINALKAARAIAEKADAEGRDLSPEENAQARTHLAEYHAAKAAHDASRPQGFANGAETVEQLKSIGLDLGLGPNPYSSPWRTPALAGGSKNFKSAAAAAWARSVGSELEKRAAGLGTKALIGTTVNISTPMGNPVTLDGPARTLLELIPVEQARTVVGSSGNTFSSLRQITRDLNARSVPDNTTKPTSDIDFIEVPAKFHVYATLAGPMPKRYLDDHAQLVEILGTQLGEGVLEAIEADILNGTGVEVLTPGSEADPFTGILQTSGIFAQPFDTDPLTTLSNARYALTDSNITPTAWVMNSVDYQALELLREGGTTGPLLFGSGRSQIESYLGDVPIVISSRIPAGTALLGDFTQTRLIPRETATLAFDSSGELFTKNQVVARMEGRWGFEVRKPSAFITVDLTA